MTNENIFNAIKKGAEAVIGYKDYLDAINVFPVKDKDTGSNLANLMDEIIANAKLGNNLNESLISISTAALIGSRGNSGIIFSQFFYGLTREINSDEPNIAAFIKQMESGYNFAYAAIENPVEGTIITLMRKWVEILKAESRRTFEFTTTLNKSNELLKLYLPETKNELKVLRDNNVVDSGALAFSIFIDSFVKSINDDSFVVKAAEPFVMNLHPFDDVISLDFRYCTELLIKTNLNKEAVYRQVKGLGDSLIIGVSGELIKIHIHTNQPDVIMQKVLNFASIIDSKVDDMYKQATQKTKTKNKIAVITDSIADLPKEVVDNQNLIIYPIQINIDGTIFLDKLSINNELIIELMTKSTHFPKTSSPSVMSIIDLLNTALMNFENILIITVSAKMSSTYNVFKNAVDKIGSPKISIIDSKQNSVSQGLIVWEALKLIEANVDFTQLYERVSSFTKQTNILVHVDSLDNMVRGGRIKKSLGFLAKLLQLKPIVSIDEKGEGIVLSKTIGRQRNIQKIIKRLSKEHQQGPIISYAITHVNNLRLAEEIKVELIRALKLAPQYITSSSQVIALNAGNKSVAVGYIRKV